MQQFRFKIQTALLDWLSSCIRNARQVHQDLMTATVNLQTLSDVIETDLSNMAKIMIDKNHRVSKTT